MALEPCHWRVFSLVTYMASTSHLTSGQLDEIVQRQADKLRVSLSPSQRDAIGAKVKAYGYADRVCSHHQQDEAFAEARELLQGGHSMADAIVPFVTRFEERPSVQLREQLAAQLDLLSGRELHTALTNTMLQIIASLRPGTIGYIANSSVEVADSTWSRFINDPGITRIIVLLHTGKQTVGCAIDKGENDSVLGYYFDPLRIDHRPSDMEVQWLSSFKRLISAD